MRLFGLPRKLRLAPLWPALAAVLTAAGLLWLLLPELLEQTATAQLEHTLGVLSPLVRSALGEPPAELHARIGQLAADSGLRITLIARDGAVIADSSVALSRLGKIEDHSGRPEVRAAGGRRSAGARPRGRPTPMWPA
jgi:hypothetical protein